MTNREKFKDELDAMLVPLITVVNGKPVICDNVSCKQCFFEKSCGKNEHKQEIVDWLNAEYQEPPVDWSNVSIDTPVLASATGEKWYRRYFAGMRDGEPETYDAGATSWSSDYQETCTWKFMKLAEGNE